VWGSLAASVVLFLPAAAALGAAGPLAVEALQRARGGSAGAAGGRVLAVSTLGSLAGTFGTTHVLVPSLGTTGAFTGAALVLLACGALLLVRSAAGTAASLVPPLLVPALAWTLGPPPARPAADGETVLAEIDSALQHIRVVETGEGAERVRTLRVNESLDSFQSIWTPEVGLLPPGHYYNHFALPYAWATRERKAPPEAWRALIVGLGAGTTVRVLAGVGDGATELAPVGVEPDPAVVSPAREFFGLALGGTDGRTAVGGLDGRAALRFTRGAFDQIVVDAYANNMEIPAHVVTVEAFAEMRERLNEDGWIAVNVGGFGPEDPVLRAVAASLATAFWDDGGASAARVPFSRNWVLFARRGGRVPEPGTRAFGSRGARLVGGTAELVRPLELDGAWAHFAPGDGTALTDDRSPTEVLQERSVERATERLRRLEAVARTVSALDASAPGSKATSAGERSARARLAESDYAGALEAAAEIEDAGARATLRAEIRWRAGLPFEALAGLLQDPEALAGRVPGLRLLADLASSVGAGALASAAVERLHACVEHGVDSGTLESAAWWRDEVTRLETAATDGGGTARALAAAIRRARGVVGVGVLVLAVLCVALARQTPRAGAA
ncbi:MAG: fused MFS/spermidine synthase, partial [Planctomycetota bacterium]